MNSQLTTQSTVDQTVDEIEIKIADFLKEHQEIEMVLPVAIGLFVTSRLGLRGANALLANLLIAGISRQIFQEFKKVSSDTLQNVQETEVKSPSSSHQTSVVQITEGCAIVHSVPGRIRLKIKQLAEDALFAKRLERLLQEDDFVIKARVNRAAASVVINYEANGLSEMDLGLRLLGLLNRANAEEMIQNGQ